MSSAGARNEPVTPKLPLIVFVYVVVVFLGIAVPIEVIFGNWIFGPSYGTMNVPRNSYRLFDSSDIYPGGGRIKYSRDQYGFRGEYGRPEDIDLLVMGGSTAAQLYVDDKDSWPEVLDAKFAEAGHPISVANAGINGQTSYGHILAFDLWFPLIPNLKPKVILAYVGINDRRLKASIRYDEMKSPDAFRRFAQYFKNHSALYRLYRIIHGSIDAREAQLVHRSGSNFDANIEWKLMSPQPDPEALRPKINEDLLGYADRIRILAEKIRSIGATPVFVSQALSTYRLRDGKVYGRVQPDGKFGVGPYVVTALFNRTLMRTCAKYKLTCFDLGSDLEFEDGDFYDEAHNTPEGSRRVADYLFERLKPIILQKGILKKN